MKKRLLALLLVLSLVVSMVPTAFAAETEQKTYVSLGASNVNGYGLRGYIPVDDETMNAAALDYTIKMGKNVLGYTSETPGSYPVLIAEKMGYDLDQLAISSMRAEELHILLDNDYYGDAYTAWRFYDDNDPNNRDKWFNIATMLTEQGFGIAKLREQYQKKIAEADVITVDIGMNNFGVYISHQLTSDYRYDEDLAVIDPALEEEFEAGKTYVKELVAEQVPEYSAMLLGMEDFVDTLAYALVGFCVNFDAVMKHIYELNPDATVVAVSIQNIMDGLYVALPDVDEEVPLGDLFGALVNAANIYIAGGSPYADQYLCTDVRQDGRVEFFLDDLIEYNGDPASLSQNIIDCFDVYDGNPGVTYDKGLHVKYALDKFCDDNDIEYDTPMLNAAYDAVASILQAAAKSNVVDMSVLNNMGDIETALLAAIKDQMVAAVYAAAADANADYELPVSFFEEVARKAGTSELAVKSVAALAVRTSIGNSFFGHPNPDGHKEIADAILATLENNTTGGDILEDEALIAAKQAIAFIEEYYDDAYAYAYAEAEKAGYIDAAVAAIDAAIAALDIDLSSTQMTDAFKAEVAGEIEKIVDTLEAAKALLLEADVLDQASLDALMALLNEAGEAGANLLNLLEQAADDTVELVVIPAVKKALDILENEIIPAVLEDLQEAVEAGTQWLLKKLNEGYNALVEAVIEALPGVDAWLYDWLYNNPDKVIAFFAEYGDDALRILAENKDAIIQVIGYIVMTYGEDIAAYVMDNADEILKSMVEWYETYGDRVWAMIEVYLNELGLLPTDEDIEAVKGALKEALEQLMDKAETLVKEQLEALVDALEDALEELKQAVINSPEIQALIKEVEDAIAALRALINDFEHTTTEMLQDALEDINDAVQNLIDTALNYADTTVRNAIKAFMDILYDATHGEYTVSKQSYYVSLGDSTVTGYGAEMGNNPAGYENHGYKTVVPGSFPYMLAEKLGLDLETEKTAAMQYIQLAMAGLRTNDLLYILDETKTPDDYFNKRVLKEYINVYGGSLEAVREDYKTELAKADLVTIAIGNCNFTGVQETGILAQWIKNDPTLSAWLNHKTFGPTIKAELAAMGLNLDAPVYAMDWDSYLNAAEQEALAAVLEETKAALIKNGIPEVETIDIGEMLELPDVSIVVNIPVADLLGQFIEWYTYCYVTHAFNYDDVLDKVHEMTRPDAQVVVVGMFNPMDELVVTYDGHEIAVGEYIDYALSVLNLSGFAYAMMNENTTYVPVHDVESVADYDMAQTGNIFELVEFISKYATEVNGNFTNHHETIAGHKYIADCIYNALTITWAEEPLWGDADGNGFVNSRDAMLVAQTFANVCDIEIDRIAADVDGNGFVNSKDAMLIAQYFAGVIKVFPVEAQN